jgi:hypothetical protein
MKSFGELITIFSKRFEPLFKFKPNSTLFEFLNFYFKIRLEFEVLPKRKVVPFELIYHLVKFGKI